VNRKLLAGCGAVAGVVLVAVGALGWSLYSSPMGWGLWYQRAALGSTLSRTEIEGPKGTIAVFEGGSGPTVVLVHGFGDQAGTWLHTAPALVDT